MVPFISAALHLSHRTIRDEGTDDEWDDEMLLDGTALNTTSRNQNGNGLPLPWPSQGVQVRETRPQQPAPLPRDQVCSVQVQLQGRRHLASDNVQREPHRHSAQEGQEQRGRRSQDRGCARYRLSPQGDVCQPRRPHVG